MGAEAGEKKDSLFQKIYMVIRRVPEGKVTTYGQVAKIVGECSARWVGFALAALKNAHDGDDVPWHRVINAQGRISLSDLEGGKSFQRALLEQEGIVFEPDGRIDLKKYGWEGL